MADTCAGDVCAVPTELNGTDLKDCVSSHSLSSNASLPSVQSGRRLRERRAASWAVSFERLLQDPLGVQYFSVSRVGLGHLWLLRGSSGGTLAQASARGLRPQDSGGGVTVRSPGATAGVSPRPWAMGDGCRAESPRGQPHVGASPLGSRSAPWKWPGPPAPSWRAAALGEPPSGTP